MQNVGSDIDASKLILLIVLYCFNEKVQKTQFHQPFNTFASRFPLSATAHAFFWFCGKTKSWRFNCNYFYRSQKNELNFREKTWITFNWGRWITLSIPSAFDINTWQYPWVVHLNKSTKSSNFELKKKSLYGTLTKVLLFH